MSKVLQDVHTVAEKFLANYLAEKLQFDVIAEEIHRAEHVSPTPMTMIVRGDKYFVGRRAERTVWSHDRKFALIGTEGELEQHFRAIPHTEEDVSHIWA